MWTKFWFPSHLTTFGAKNRAYIGQRQKNANAARPLGDLGRKAPEKIP